MGLMDILNGMQNGPRGTPGKGGMSPMTMALLGLIAFKAVKSLSGGTPSAPSAAPGAGSPVGAPGGGVDGGALSGGLGDLLKKFEQGGKGSVASSWVGAGPNKAISPNDLANVLGEDRINELSSLSGVPRDDLLNGLSQQLPGLVDQLTPNGRLPTAQEVARML